MIAAAGSDDPALPVRRIHVGEKIDSPSRFESAQREVLLVFQVHLRVQRLAQSGRVG